MTRARPNPLSASPPIPRRRGAYRGVNSARPLQETGGDDNLPPMDQDINLRLSRLEGGNNVLMWAAGIVSATILGLAAIIVTLQIFMFQGMTSLQAKVDALPDQINRNLLELNRTLADSITAAKVGSQQPQVIVIPSQQPMANVPPQ